MSKNEELCIKKRGILYYKWWQMMTNDNFPSWPSTHTDRYGQFSVEESVEESADFLLKNVDFIIQSGRSWRSTTSSATLRSQISRVSALKTRWFSLEKHAVIDVWTRAMLILLSRWPRPWWVKMMSFSFKTRNFVSKTRNVVLKTRNFRFENEGFCFENEEYCI